MYFHGILININWGGTEGVVLQSFTFASDRFWKSLLPYHPKHSVSNVVHSVFPSRRNFNSNRPPLSTESDVLNQHTANLYSVSELNLTKKKRRNGIYRDRDQRSDSGQFGDLPCHKRCDRLRPLHAPADPFVSYSHCSGFGSLTMILFKFQLKLGLFALPTVIQLFCEDFNSNCASILLMLH